MRIGKVWLAGACVAALAGCQKQPTPQHTPAVGTAEVAVDPLPDPAPEEPADLAPDEFFAHARDAVVVVRNPAASSLGSGVEIQAGVFVTNCHVLEGGDRFSIERRGKTYAASLMRADTYRDICLLRAYAGVPSPVATRSATGVDVGERVYALGNPQGFELTLSEGLVSQLRRISDDQVEPYIQTTAAISQGSSGGGLFDRKGRLIGIPSFMWREGQNLNFAAPVDWALALAEGKPIAGTPAAEEEPARPSAQSLNDAAVELINSDRAADAIQLLQKAVELEPDNPEVRGNLGYAYLLESDFERARESLLSALTLAPKRSSTWLNLGETYAALGEKDAAVRSVVNGYALSSRKRKVRDSLSRVSADESASPLWREVADASLAAIDVREGSAPD